MVARGAKWAAKAAGLKTYLSDQPCPRGHLSERRVTNSKCMECEAIDRRERTPEQRERRNELWRQYYRANPEPFRERSAALRRKLQDEEPEKLRAALAEWHLKNPEKSRAIRLKTITKNREAIIARKREAYRRDPQKHLERNKAWQQQNRHKTRLYTKKNCKGRKHATPPWLTKEQWHEIKQFYWLAQDCSIVTGERYWVDHIVPLRGKTVCGLHVPWNLQVLPREVNQRKSNRFE